STNISLERKTEQEISNQGNTVHAKLVISGSCLRNRGYVSNRDVPYRSSLRYNTMAPYTFPRDNTVAANYTHQQSLIAVHCDITQWDPIHSRVIIQWQPITHTSSTEAFALIEVHTAAGGEHINRATFVISGKDRREMFHVQH